MNEQDWKGLDQKVLNGTARTSDLIFMAKEALRRETAALAPDGNITPSVGFLLPNTFAVLPVPIQMFNSGFWKDVLAQKVAMVVRENKARCACMVMRSWMACREVSRAELEKIKAMPIREAQNFVMGNPESVEILALMVYDRNGEQMTFTRVTRHTNRHPELGEWEDFPQHQTKSRFAETIMPAFLENN